MSFDEQETMRDLKSLNARLSNSLRNARAENKALRNELCLKCGSYKEAHKGACDGCRWKECEE